MIHKILKAFTVLSSGAGVSAMFRHGVAASVEHINVLSGVKCRMVVDIGANCGQFALISRKCFPNAKIESFEPLAEPADRFEKVFAGDKNTHLHRLAIGKKEGQATIHVSNRDDSSSLLPIGEAQTTLFPGTGEREIRMIRVAPLDTVLTGAEILQPAMLKLDVQGFELEALRGCEKLLERFFYIYVECSFVELYKGQALAWEVIDFLHKHDFCLDGVYNLSCDHKGRAIQADFMFIKSNI